MVQEIEVKRYRIGNRITREQMEIEAESYQEACQKCGWQLGDCWQVVGPRRYERGSKPGVPAW